MRKISHVLTATATAVSLALVAPQAMAEDGSLQSQSDQIPEGSLQSITEQLGTAYEALTSEVKVVRNGENVTVTYTNKTEAAQKCSGLVMPYESVVEQGLDADDAADQDTMVLLEKFTEIFTEGNSSQMGAGIDGSPAVKAGSVLTGIELLGLGLQGAVGAGVGVDAGKSVTWTVTSPDEHATAVVMCDGSVIDSDAMKTYKGIEKDVLFDQVKDKLGPVGSVVDLSSENAALGGSFISGIPFLTTILNFFDKIFGGLLSLLGISPSAGGSSVGEGAEGADGSSCSSDNDAPAAE